MTKFFETLRENGEEKRGVKPQIVTTAGDWSFALFRRVCNPCLATFLRGSRDRSVVARAST